MMLHQESLALAAFAVSLALTASLSAMGIILRGQPGLRWWILALWLAAGGTVLLGFRGRLPDVIPVMGGHTLLALGAVMTWAGVRELCERPLKLGLGLGFTGSYLAVHAYFLFGYPSFAIRGLNYTAMSAAWNLAIAWTLFRHAPSDLLRSFRLVASLFLVDALGSLGILLFKALDPQAAAPQRLNGLAAAQYLQGVVLGTLEVMGFVLLLNHRLLRKVQESARRDGLTGVLNRRALDEEASRLLEVCHRQRIPCALAMIDLDHFKDLNDRFGHAAGDAALRHIANLLQGELRKADLLGRYGGEEFCILMPGTPLELARGVAERLRERATHCGPTWNGQALPLTFSLGLACSEGLGAADYPALQGRADRCLYQAKQRGRDRVEIEGGAGGSGD